MSAGAADSTRPLSHADGGVRLSLRDQHLVGALGPAGARAFQPPAQPDPVRCDAERVDLMRAAQPGRVSGVESEWQCSHSLVAPSVRPETK